MNEAQMIAAIADLQARTGSLERDNEKIESRVGGIEKVLWGWGGAIGLLAFAIGVLSSWIKDKLAGV